MVQKEPYDKEAKQYLTQKALKLSETRWQALEDSQREELLSKELWIKENCEVGPFLAFIQPTWLSLQPCNAQSILAAKTGSAHVLYAP